MKNPLRPSSTRFMRSYQDYHRAGPGWENPLRKPSGGFRAPREPRKPHAGYHGCIPRSHPDRGQPFRASAAPAAPAGPRAVANFPPPGREGAAGEGLASGPFAGGGAGPGFDPEDQNLSAIDHSLGPRFSPPPVRDQDIYFVSITPYIVCDKGIS